MIFPCITLLVLHQSYAQISVMTVPLGEPATLTCVFKDSEYSSIRVKWHRQIIGRSLTLIATLIMSSKQTTLQPGFPPTRFHANYSSSGAQSMSTLTILKTVQEDEAVYHCAVFAWNMEEWTGTYLSIKGNTRTTDSSVFQRPTSDTVNPGDSVSLQCLVHSNYSKPCSDEHSVYWFGVRASHPNILYTDGNKRDVCEKNSDTQKSCAYHLSKNINSSDAGTYYCAVAACGEILFGNGTKLHIEETGWWSSLVGSMFLLLLCTLLIVLAVLMYAIKTNKDDHCNNQDVSLLDVAQMTFKRREDTWLYSTVVFTLINTGSGGRRDAQAAAAKHQYMGTDWN